MYTIHTYTYLVHQLPTFHLNPKKRNCKYVTDIMCRHIGTDIYSHNLFPRLNIEMTRIETKMTEFG